MGRIDEQYPRKLADAAFICTPDLLHYEPAIRALELDYDLVLEKPISPVLDQCREITRFAQERHRLVQVCHVLHFTDFWKKIKEVLDSGRIGKIIHYDHSENVSFWHMSHSYVRGWYRIKEDSSPMILAKCCHDLDLMTWILGQKPLSVQSSGSLTCYRPENAPPGVPERCTDGCPIEKECPWFAPRLYCTGDPLGTNSPPYFFKGTANGCEFGIKSPPFHEIYRSICSPSKKCR